MSFLVTGGAVGQCSFGVAPSSLTVLPKMQAQVLLPVGSSMDSLPLANVMPHAMCNSIANPTVAAATAAALGVLTPMPCVPATTGPWLPGKLTVLVGGCPALTSDSVAVCAYGGIIQIRLPGQTSVMI